MDDALQFFIVIFALVILFGLALLFNKVYNMSEDVSACFDISEKTNCTPITIEGKNFVKCMLTIKNNCPQEYNVTLELV